MPRAVMAILILLYPALIFFGDRYVDAPVLAIALIPMLVLHHQRVTGARWMLFSVAALGLLAALFDDTAPLKLYPVLVNLGLLATFAASLRFPPTAIERIARLHEPNLSPEGVAYTRNVTWVWCAFFAMNAMVSLATMLWSSDMFWFLYNGVIAYFLIGAMFVGEWLFRRFRLQTGHG